MTIAKTSMLSAARSWLSRRRFPTLLLIAGALLVGDALLPDPIPFADELILMVLTTALAAWRKRPALPPVDQPTGPG